MYTTLELGQKNPLADNFQLHSVLQGIKRQKGNEPHYKLPLGTDDLIKMYKLVDKHSVEDTQIWCALLICFFGLLRISAVSTVSKTHWDAEKILCRQDLDICSNGCTLKLRRSKTNQFKERTHCVVLPFIRDSPLCPTSALLEFLGQAGHVPQDYPLLTRCCAGQLEPLSQGVVRHRLSSLLSSIGLPAGEYGTHSLRRGGATWLLSCGVPLHVIKVMGDWRSNCVFKYLKPGSHERFNILTDITKELPTT
jgi:integrase